MSKHEWKPGDVAVVTTRTGIEYRAVWTLAPGVDYYWRPLTEGPKTSGLTDPDVSARPLVVIDPAGDEVTDLAAALAKATAKAGLPWEGSVRERAGVLRGVLREFANPPPPKPNEPTGWLAAVVDAEGNRWCISGGPIEPPKEWYSPDLNESRAYADIAAVRVLSEGVS